MFKRFIWKSFSNQTENKKEAKRIKDEFQKGYWNDFKALNSTGGRFYEPTNSLNLDIKIPDIKVTDLLNNKTTLAKVVKGRPTIIGIAFNEYGNLQLNDYKSFYDTNLKGTIQYVHISVEETWLKSIILKAVIPHLRSKIPKEEHSKYLLSTFKKVYDLKEELGILNKYTPWVYLINKRGAVRWNIHGKPSDTELKLLQRLAKQVSLE